MDQIATPDYVSLMRSEVYVFFAGRRERGVMWGGDRRDLSVKRSDLQPRGRRFESQAVFLGPVEGLMPLARGARPVSMPLFFGILKGVYHHDTSGRKRVKLIPSSVDIFYMRRSTLASQIQYLISPHDLHLIPKSPTLAPTDRSCLIWQPGHTGAQKSTLGKK